MQKKFLSIFKYQNSRIAKYIRRNLVTLFFAIVFIIGLVLFGNQFVLTVQESVEEGIPFQELMPLVSFNMIRDVSLVLSLSLFRQSLGKEDDKLPQTVQNHRESYYQ